MIDDLNEILTRHPFGPFRIVTASGEKYKVDNPGNLVVMATRIFYAYPRRDRWVFIRLNQITALESVSRRKAS